MDMDVIVLKPLDSLCNTVGSEDFGQWGGLPEWCHNGLQ